MLHHALAVASALSRTLVLPPLMTQPHQMSEPSEQQWHNFSHFFNITRLLDAGFDVVTQEEWKDVTGGVLPFYYYPPYMIPSTDTVVGD